VQDEAGEEKDQGNQISAAMKLTLQVNRFKSLTIPFVSRLLALVILTSFIVSQISIVSTLAEESSMPCCVGKTEGHCDSGLTKPKPRPVITEPMCGLKWSPPVSAPVNKITFATNDPVAVDAAAVEKECQMDCGACATVTARHKRQKSLVQARVTQEAPATITTTFNHVVSVCSSNENWTQINPRGPPAIA
jgi:hypothetical protein